MLAQLGCLAQFCQGFEGGDSHGVKAVHSSHSDLLKSSLLKAKGTESGFCSDMVFELCLNSDYYCWVSGCCWLTLKRIVASVISMCDSEVIFQHLRSFLLATVTRKGLPVWVVSWLPPAWISWSCSHRWLGERRAREASLPGNNNLLFLFLIWENL